MTMPTNPALSVLPQADWQRFFDKTRQYVLASYDLMDKAGIYFSEGDLRQASEKGWGAAAQIVKAVAENWKGYGARHRGHQHLIAMVAGLSMLDPAGGLDAKFREARSLHENFYENDLSESAVESYLRRGGLFVNAMLPWLQWPAPPQNFRQYYRRRRSPSRR